MNPQRNGAVTLPFFLQSKNLTDCGLQWRKKIAYVNSRVPDLVPTFLLIPSDLEHLTFLSLSFKTQKVFSLIEAAKVTELLPALMSFFVIANIVSRNGCEASLCYLRGTTNHALL